jgi:subtilisin family serine protease
MDLEFVGYNYPYYMRTAKISLALILLLATAGAYAQTGKPLMKITIKDGAVIKAEPVDSAPTGFKPSADQISNTGTRDTQTLGPVKNSTVGVSTAGNNAASPVHSDAVAGANASPKNDALSQPLQDVGTEVISKGSSQRAGRVSYTSAVLDKTAKVQWLNNPDKVPAPSDAPMSTVTVLYEDFEGVFPGSWSAYAQGVGDAYWDDVNNRAYAGSWSAWCAAAGTGAQVPGTTYLDYMDSWMVYGPFSLADANAAVLSFKNFNDTESGYDYLKWMASVDGLNFYGYQIDGNSGGWVDRTLDLGNVPELGNLNGQSQVWIAFQFESDVSITYEGSYVDNVVLEKTTGLPNLRWTFMALSGTTWTPGATVTVDLTETNDGQAAAGGHYSRIYMSADSFVDDFDILLGTDMLFNSLTNGFDQTQSMNFTVPSVADGIYYLGALVDYYGHVIESDEADNGGTRSGTIELLGTPPDLTWTTLALSTSTWSVGSDVTATLTEQNIGSGNADYHTTRFYLSTNTSITDLDVMLGSDMLFFPIAAGGTQSVGQTFTVPDVVQGTYYIGAIVDFYNEISESNEGNNALYRTGTVDVAVPQYVDLHGVSMGLSAETWIPGTSTTAYFTEGNGGTATADAHTSRLYLSTDTFMEEGIDLQLGSDLSFSSILAGETQMQSGTFTAPDVPEGTYYIGAIIDFFGNVSETDKANNNIYRTGAVTVPAAGGTADLLWTALTFDTDIWNSGATINAQLTVSNAGDGASISQSSRLYLSTNDIISTGDVQLGGDITFGAIASLGSESQGAAFSAPALNGVYWVGAIVDYYNAVPETDEENNGGSRVDQVTVTGTGDTKDLQAFSLGLSTETWVIGNTIDAEFTEQNAGTLATEAHSSRLVLSDNVVITDTDTPLGSAFPMAAALAGEYIVGNSSFSVPDVPTGVYYVGVFVDVNNDVAEDDESNNVAYRTGTVDVINAVADIHVTPSSLTLNEAVGGSSAGAGSAAPLAKGKDPYATNRMIIKFRSDVGSNARSMATVDKGLETLNARYKLSGVRSLGGGVKQLSASNGNMLVMTLDGAADIQAAISEYRKLGIVEFAEPDYIVKNTHREDFVPEDPMFIEQWGLKNTGNAISYYNSPVGTFGEDINVESAWDITMGSSNIIVAVIDDGVDTSHPEFSGRLVAGYDFVNDDNDPNPLSTDGHGNACAGIIAAANDGVGVIGVAPGVRIMPLKSLQDGSGFHSDIVPAIYYAVDNGAKVISMSLGGTSSSLAYETAVNYAVSQGVVVLAAAGNDNVDNLVEPHYPASYASVISVGAMSPCGLRKTPTTCDGEFWWGSNFGNLDFITPGTRIATTDVSGSGGYSPTNYTPSFNGTSAATPFAAGVAALILSLDPTLTPAEVRQIMQSSAVDVGPAGYDSDNGHGRVNALAALQLVEGGGGSDLVTITNAGQGVLTITAVNTNQAWLGVSGLPSVPFYLATGESAVATVSVDWGMLSTTATGDIAIESGDNDEPLVLVNVTANPASVETYSVNVVADPIEGGNITGSGNYAAGQVVTLTANPAQQYVFVNWSENGSIVSSSPEYSFTLTGGRDLIAHFQPASYTVSATANPVDGGVVQGAGNYTTGQTATLQASALGAYAFLNWTEEDEIVSHAALYEFNVTGHRALVANFSVEFYNIGLSISQSGAGTVTGAGRYGTGQTASVIAVPTTGFQFASWREDGNVVSTEPTYIFNVTSNRNLLAEFIIETRTVTATVNPSNAGTVTGAGTYNYGQQAILQAAPAIGYGFVNWTANGVLVSTAVNYSFIVLSDVNLVANFQYSQTIAFDPLTDVTYGDPYLTLQATATSGLPVAFNSSNPSVLAIDGNIATIVGAGTVNVTAYQPGNTAYLAAPNVTRSLTVNKASQSISFSLPGSMLISDPALTLNATATSGLTITYESTNSGILQINGNTAQPAGLGFVEIVAKQAGDANYHAATDVTQGVTVTKGTQEITFTALPAKAFGDQPFALNASSSSGLEIAYVSSNPSVATVSGNEVTVLAVGTTVITASQAGDDEFDAALSVDQLLTVNKAGQTITFSLTPEMKFSLDLVDLIGSATSGLPVSFNSSNPSVATISSGNVLSLVGVGITTITASQEGNDNFNASSPVQRTLLVTKGDQTITFPAIVSLAQGDAEFDLQAISNSGLPLVFISSDPSRLRIANGVATLLAPGRVTIRAMHAGDANWNAAQTVTRSFCINPLKPTITLSNQTTGFPILRSSSEIGNRWYFNDVEIALARQQTFATTTQEQQGNYKVQVVVEGCTSELSDQVSVIVTGIEEEENAMISVYPNPFVEDVFVNVSGIAGGSQAVVKMYDATGRVLRSATGSGEVRLEAASLSSGSYLVHIQAGDRVVTKRIVKVK